MRFRVSLAATGLSLHILHIDLGREMRGGQHQVLLLLQTLRGAGHSFTLLARGGSPLFEKATEMRFPVQPASLLNLRRLSGEHDIVHAHDAKAHSWAALVSRRPFVVSRRVAFAVKSSAVSRWKYGRAARFQAVSQFVSLKLQEAGIAESRIDVVFDAVEDCGMQSWNPDGPVVALNSADPKKGTNLVVGASALAIVPVTFSKDIKKDFAGASAFVYISHSEGFGSAALVAMSMGVPVIVSRIDGMVEVVEDGVSGLTVENDDLAIAEAIERVLQNPDATRAMIARARERVQSLFSPSVLLRKTLASYRKALGV
jgi:phosphohistidine swiveling domain-containing protein